MILLWHGREPVGICVFAAPAASLSLAVAVTSASQTRDRASRSRRSTNNSGCLQRVVLHPTYRGAGIAAAFVRRACELCPVDWIETLSAMGHANPFFERAGFTRVGVDRAASTSRRRPLGVAQYAGKSRRVTTATRTKSHFSDPVYYVFDNRKRTS